jgi:hypothetical protein
MDTHEGLELNKVVDQLRAELLKLAETVRGEDLQFTVDSVELELKVGVKKGGEAGAQAKFWVLELGGKGTYEKEATQTIKLKLTPNFREKGKGEASKGPVKIGRRAKK